jgi:DNA recombination protein RmuC
VNSTELLISLIALLFGIAIGWGISHFLGKTSSEGAVATAQDLEKLKNEITNLSLSLRSKEGESELLKNQLEQEQQKSKANDFIEIQFRAMTDLVERLKRDAVEADRRRSTTEGELKAKIEEMTNKSALLATQTQAIAGALTNSQNRGRFGEAHLERLLDSAGLVRGIHYFAQQDIADDVHGEERSLRPDITIKMPNSREIYIDSKFPFQRFYEAYESEDETLRQSLLQEHTKDLLKHCEALSKKKYSASISSPDFVIVFAPIESIFTEALRSDPGFLDKIYKYGVTVATPTSLFAILRTVGDVFSRYQVAESASEIQGLASKFLADISSLYEKVKTVGDRLSSTVKAYNEMVPTAEKTILRNVKKMRELNVSGPEVKAIEEISLPVRELKSKIAISGHGEDIEEAIELSFEEEE